MKTVVIGGHSRKVGKTSVAAALIRALPEFSWTAVKISSHWHGQTPADGNCNIHEERSPGNNSDSARYLAAGAARSFWIRVPEKRFDEAMPEIRAVLRSNPFAIIESNGILRYMRPDLCLMVLRNEVPDFKESAGETLRQADGVVVVGQGPASPDWKNKVDQSLAEVPVFITLDPQILPEGLADFVRARLRTRTP
jgi:hypothetical protein